MADHRGVHRHSTPRHRFPDGMTTNMIVGQDGMRAIEKIAIGEEAIMNRIGTEVMPEAPETGGEADLERNQDVSVAETRLKPK